MAQWLTKRKEILAGCKNEEQQLKCKVLLLLNLLSLSVRFPWPLSFPF
jgi:hypothetical protein